MKQVPSAIDPLPKKARQHVRSGYLHLQRTLKNGDSDVWLGQD